MSRIDVLPELRQLMGAMLFAAKKPLTAAEIRRVLQQVAEQRGGPYRDYAKLKPKEIEDAVRALGQELGESRLGFQINEMAKGFRLENDAACGPWLRQLLEKGKAPRLSRPALETLAIIAYRQPAARSEIEAVRGVAVDQIVRNLLEMQLVRVVGRSELPGRPWLFGTTQKFLEHFGLKSLDELPGVDELRRLAPAPAGPDPGGQADPQLELAVGGEAESNGDAADPPAPAPDQADEEEEEEEDLYEDEDEDEDEDEEAGRIDLAD